MTTTDTLAVRQPDARRGGAARFHVLSVLLPLAISFGFACASKPDLEAQTKNLETQAKDLETQTKETASKMDSDRYYQLVLIWMKDPAKFGQYAQKAGPLAVKYGSGLERMLAPDAIYAEGMKKPDIANIVFYRDQQAAKDFERDPDFKKVEHLRSEAIEMITVGGLPVDGSVSQEELAKRLYLVEIASFGEGGKTAYDAYQAKSEPVMKRYGYNVERILKADEATGFGFKPNVVKIAYFDDAAGMEKFHGDPKHPELEKAYPAAVKNSVWLIAKVHPMSLGGSH